MKTTILTVEHFDGIRALISPDVTDVHISDEYLLQEPFAPEAEKEIRRRLDAEGIDVDTLTDDVLGDARLAMLHACASVLCLTAPQLLRQSQLQVSMEVQRVDWKQKREFHLSEVDRKVEAIVSLFNDGGVKSAIKRKLPFIKVG